MADDRTVVHELMIDALSFATIAEGIRTLSVERLKFQRLKDVVIESVNHPPQPTAKQIELFKNQLPLDGRVRIFLRLPTDLNARLDRLKSDLCDRLGDNCGVRETLVFCAMVIAQRNKQGCQL